MNAKSDSRANIAFFLITVPLGLWLVWDALSFRLVTYSLWADYWEHSATLTEWMRDLVNPGNPHLADGSSSSRYIPTYLALAVIGKIFGLNAVDLMGISSIMNYVLTVLGIYLFCRIYFQNSWAPFTGVLVFFTVWGIPWIWANLYQLRSFFYVSGYPASFVFALSLISFWLSLRFLRCQTGLLIGLMLLLGLSALMFVSHALTGVFGIVGCCLLACTDRDAPLSMRMLVILTMLAGAFIAELWPYFSVWDVILNKSDEVDDRTWQSFQGFGAMLERARSGAWWHMLYSPRDLVVGLGPALIGIPICLWLLIKRQQIFILAGLAIMTVPYLGNIFFQIALAHRFLFYMVFFLHLAIIWAVIQLISRRQEIRSQNASSPITQLSFAAVAICFVTTGVANVWMLAEDFRGNHLNLEFRWVDKRRFLPAGSTVVDVYKELTRDLPESAVVFGNAKLTWPLPTFKGKAVALPENHENSLVPDEAERVAAEQIFMAPTSSDRARLAAARSFAATHVLVNVENTAPELLSWLTRNGELLSKVERYEMYQL